MGRMSGDPICPRCGSQAWCDCLEELMTRRVPRFEKPLIEFCTRQPFHDGPCNGYPAQTCSSTPPPLPKEFRGPEDEQVDAKRDPDGAELHVELLLFLKNDRFADLFHDAVRTLRAKNADYSGKDDRIANFRRLSVDLGLPMRQVWFVFFSKSLDAIRTYARDGQVESEPIRQRIIDAIDYLALLDMIVAEEK